jgi:hypothetical protein
MGSAISLHTIDSAISSVEIKTAAGQALAIDGSGRITANINGTVTVSATNLDIRDLTSASDSIEIKTAAGQALAIDGSGFITSNINGTVTVSATNLDIRNLVFADDKVDVSGSSVSITGTVATAQGAFTTWQTAGVTVGNTAAQLAGTPLTGRDEIAVQNLSNDDIYVGPTNAVTTSGATRGRKIARGTELVIPLDASADIYAIGAVGSQAVVVSEYAY